MQPTSNSIINKYGALKIRMIYRHSSHSGVQFNCKCSLFWSNNHFENVLLNCWSLATQVCLNTFCEVDKYIFRNIVLGQIDRQMSNMIETKMNWRRVKMQRWWTIVCNQNKRPYERKLWVYRVWKLAMNDSDVHRIGSRLPIVILLKCIAITSTHWLLFSLLLVIAVSLHLLFDLLSTFLLPIFLPFIVCQFALSAAKSRTIIYTT